MSYMPIVCYYCEEVISQDEPREYHESLGYAHPDCMIRPVLGGANHILGVCSCCGGTQPPDDPSLTRREAATQAVKLWHLLTDNQRTATFVRRTKR